MRVKEVNPEPTSPWFYAAKDQRHYITPEDIRAAINAGGTKVEVWQGVLVGVQAGACEDMRCCAFVALDCKKE